MKVLAIIPAAGTGVRMGGELPKQFLSLDGTSIFVYTLRKFAASDAISDIFLGVRGEDRKRVESELARENLEKPVRLISGGYSRQETVSKALSQAPEDTEVVVVHDAVRPFVELETIRAAVNAARQEGAAIVGVPSVDTVKQVDRQWVSATIPRERIVLAQTPQAFRFSILKEANDRAEADGFKATDESSLVERMGQPVMVLMGSDHNIKITKPSDLPLARLFLAQEKEQGESR